MLVTCPNGHEVKPALYCGVCGVSLPRSDPSSPRRSETTLSSRPNRHSLILAGTLLSALLIGAATYFGITWWTGSDSGGSSLVPTSAYSSSATTKFSPQPPDQAPGSPPSSNSLTARSSPTAAGPKRTVEEYFDAINAGHYKHAWELGGKNLQGGSYSSFVQGFENTARDSVTIVSVVGDTVEVELDATQSDGTHRNFAGTYTVRKGVIVAADIHPQ